MLSANFAVADSASLSEDNLLLEKRKESSLALFAAKTGEDISIKNGSTASLTGITWKEESGGSGENQVFKAFKGDSETTAVEKIIFEMDSTGTTNPTWGSGTKNNEATYSLSNGDGLQITSNRALKIGASGTGLLAFRPAKPNEKENKIEVNITGKDSAGNSLYSNLEMWGEGTKQAQTISTITLAGGMKGNIRDWSAGTNTYTLNSGNLAGSFLSSGGEKTLTLKNGDINASGAADYAFKTESSSEGFVILEKDGASITNTDKSAIQAFGGIATVEFKSNGSIVGGTETKAIGSGLSSKTSAIYAGNKINGKIHIKMSGETATLGVTGDIVSFDGGKIAITGKNLTLNKNQANLIARANTEYNNVYFMGQHQLNTIVANKLTLTLSEMQAVGAWQYESKSDNLIVGGEGSQYTVTTLNTQGGGFNTLFIDSSSNPSTENTIKVSSINVDGGTNRLLIGKINGITNSEDITSLYQKINPISLDNLSSSMQALKGKIIIGTKQKSSQDSITTKGGGHNLLAANDIEVNGNISVANNNGNTKSSGKNKLIAQTIKVTGNISIKNPYGAYDANVGENIILGNKITLNGDILAEGTKDVGMSDGGTNTIVGKQASTIQSAKITADGGNWDGQAINNVYLTSSDSSDDATTITANSIESKTSKKSINRVVIGKIDEITNESTLSKLNDLTSDNLTSKITTLSGKISIGGTSGTDNALSTSHGQNLLAAKVIEVKAGAGANKYALKADNGANALYATTITITGDIYSRSGSDGQGNNFIFGGNGDLTISGGANGRSVTHPSLIADGGYGSTNKIQTSGKLTATLKNIIAKGNNSINKNVISGGAGSQVTFETMSALDNKSDQRGRSNNIFIIDTRDTSSSNQSTITAKSISVNGNDLNTNRLIIGSLNADSNLIQLTNKNFSASISSLQGTITLGTGASNVDILSATKGSNLLAADSISITAVANKDAITAENGGKNLLKGNTITLKGADKSGGTPATQNILRANGDNSSNSLEATRISINEDSKALTAISAQGRGSNTLKANTISINGKTGGSVIVANGSSSNSHSHNTFTTKTLTIVDPNAGTAKNTIQANNGGINTFNFEEKDSSIISTSPLYFSGSGTAGENVINLTQKNVSVTLKTANQEKLNTLEISSGNAIIALLNHNTSFTAEKITLSANAKLGIVFEQGKNSILKSDIQATDTTNVIELYSSRGAEGILDKTITLNGATLNATLAGKDSSLWIKNPHTQLNNLTFSDSGIEASNKNQTLNISSKENTTQANNAHTYNLLLVGTKAKAGNSLLADASSPSGLKGNNGVFKVFVGEKGSFASSISDHSSYSKIASDRIVVHSIQDSNNPSNTPLSASIILDTSLSTLSKITYTKGGSDNVAVFTVINQPGSKSKDLSNLAQPVLEGQSSQSIPSVELIAQTLDFGGESITIDLKKEDTDEYGKSGSSVSNKNYTTYFISGAESKGLDTSIQSLYSTALMLNYDLYIANFNSLNKRLGELRANPKTNGIWARVFGGELSNDFGVGSQTTYVTTQAGYDHAFGFNGANNYLGLALSYAHSNSSSNIAYHSNKQTYLNDISSNAFEFAIYNSYVGDGVSLEDLKNNAWDKGFYSDTILKLALIQSNFSFSDATSINQTTNNIGLVFSQEVGYMLKFGEEKQWGITPLYELGLGYLSSSEFKREIDGSSQKATQNALLNLRNKIGVVWSYNINALALGRKDQNASVYLGTAYENDYIIGGENSFSTALSPTQSSNSSLRNDGRFVLNLGSNITLNKDTRLYVDIEKSFKGKINTDLQFNFGARFSFGENTSYKPLQKEERGERGEKENKAPIKIEEK